MPKSKRSSINLPVRDMAIELTPHAGERRVVNSYNEWDPLEEIIVGTLDGATVPSWHVALRATMPTRMWPFFRENGGKPFPPELVALANRDLEGLVRVLEAEGVTVRRPEFIDHGKAFATPCWESAGGLYAAMPRDLLLVLGDEIIEAPMPWRSRYFEIHAYRPLLTHYFREGARWSAAPKPRLADDLYDADYEQPTEGERMRYVINETEPVFDAADFIRCGRDVFYILSHVTNALGVEWLRRHLGTDYRFHRLMPRDTKAMHIDTTFLPLAPGKMLVNPERVSEVPPILRQWELLEAPPPCTPDDVPLYFSGKWLSMNVLMLDEKRVVVAKHEETLIRALVGWGFTPIPVEFKHFYAFGGSIHCATLDVRRRGGLRSYF